MAATSDGELFIVEGMEMKQYIENAFSNSGAANQSMGEETADDFIVNISAIKEYAKGFFVASDTGHLAVWVRSEENNSTSGKQAYDFIRKWQPAPTKGIKVLGMTVSAGDDYLALSLSNNNIGLVHLKTLGINEDVTREVKFDLVCRGFHSGSIDAIDIAIQRPIIVTCSKVDSTIRLWNYYTHQCVLAREYYVLEDMAIREAARPLKSVAMHPSGYYLAASFIDKIRLYHILHDELRHYRSLEVKGCNLMRFNAGGNLLFVVDQKNVLIYNAYTLVKLHQIRGTSESVTDIVFGDHDSSFALITPDGFFGRYRMPSF